MPGSRALEDHDLPGSPATRSAFCITNVRRPIRKKSFQRSVETVLVPTPAAGDIVALDNLGSHKSQAVRKAVRAAAALIHCSCRPTVPIRTRSGGCSSSSGTCCERLPGAPLRPHGAGSASCSDTSRQPNAPTTSSTHARLRHRPISPWRRRSAFETMLRPPPPARRLGTPTGARTDDAARAGRQPNRDRRGARLPGRAALGPYRRQDPPP